MRNPLNSMRVRMLPKEAREIYRRLRHELTDSKSRLEKFEYDDITTLSTFESTGEADLLPKSLHRKLKLFYETFNNEYKQHIQLNEAEKIAKKYEVNKQPNSQGFLKDIVLTGKNKKTNVQTDLANKADFWAEIEELRSCFLKCHDGLLRQLNTELLPELARQFPKDLMSLENRKDILTIISLALTLILALGAIMGAFWTHSSASAAANLAEITKEEAKLSRMPMINISEPIGYIGAQKVSVSSLRQGLIEDIFEICVLNKGGVGTDIILTPEGDLAGIFKISSRQSNITDYNSKCFWVRSSAQCFYNYSNCTEAIFPDSGNLNINVICKACSENREIEKSIPIEFIGGSNYSN